MSESTPPNILVLLADELRADALGCTGNPDVKSPHIDGLAEDSVVFSNAYCTQPVCTPARASLLTGLYPHTHGCYANNAPLSKQKATIAEMLGDAYHSAWHGKWHLGDEITAQRGFEDWVSIEDAIYRPYYSQPEDLKKRSDYHYFLQNYGFVPDETAFDGVRTFSRETTAVMPSRYTKAHFLGQTASSFLHNYDKSKPFFLAVSFLEPHMPFWGPFNDHYDPMALSVSESFCHPPGSDAPLRNRLLAGQYPTAGYAGFELNTEAQWRRVLANYYGLVSLIDLAIGQILSALKASGHLENTIVILTADHGDMMGNHALLEKGVMYEESVRVPLIIRMPNNADATQYIPERISQIDLAPTLLDLAQQPIPDDLQGKSIAPVLHGEASMKPEDVVVEWNSDQILRKVEGFSDEEAEIVSQQYWRTLIDTEGWKLNTCATDTWELYQLNDDPHELNNLIDHEPQRVQQMTEKLKIWQEQHQDIPQAD